MITKEFDDFLLKTMKENNPNLNILKKIRPTKNSIDNKNYEYINISNAWVNTKRAKLTAVDIFCGCGGISKGLEMAGIEVIAGLDFFKEAGDTYTHNFSHPFIFGDVTQRETKQELYKIVRKQLKGKQLNILAGGFPCQGFSMAGKRNLNDPRNRLYKELLEIVQELDPEIIFMENVKGLLSMNKGQVKEQILQDFKDIGYNISVQLFNSADYEVPQKRERVVFIGNRIGKTNYYPLPIVQDQEYKTIKDAIVDLMKIEEDVSFNHTLTKHTEEMIERLSKVKEGESLYSNYSDSWKRCYWNAPSNTIKENHGAVNIHPKLPRVLTVRECARIQSFPDNFIFKGTKSKQLVQIGNAVPPLLAKAIGLSIKEMF